MATQKQIRANRRNARKSTGPRTPEGKAASRFNALKSGIDAQSNCIPGEDPTELQTLADEYSQRFTPTLPEHRALIDSLISNEWLLRRLRKIEAQIWEYEMPRTERWDRFNEDCPLGSTLSDVEHELVRLQRRMDSADRAYHRALNQLRRLQQTPLEPLPSDPEPIGPPEAGVQPTINQERGTAIGFVPSNSEHALPPMPADPVPAPIASATLHELLYRPCVAESPVGQAPGLPMRAESSVGQARGPMPHTFPKSAHSA